MAFRDGPLQDLRLPLAWAGGVATAVAVVIALVLVLVGRRAPVAMTSYAPARMTFDGAAQPVGETLEAPVRWTGDAWGYVRGYFLAVSENRRLRQQVHDLEGWRDTAIALRNVNDRYEALLKLKTEPDAPMVAARTVLDARGPFADARLLDVGTEAGVQVGDPVLSEHGVVGRIVGATHGVSRVLMLTDVESRTPVLVDRTNARAILTGDGGGYPRLEYVRGREPVKDGDMILTSGDGGVFPRGLPVGVAARDLGGTWRAHLYSDQTPVDFVRILLFQDFGSAVNPATLSGGATPPLTTAEQADRAAVLQRAVQPPPSAATVSTSQNPKPQALEPEAHKLRAAKAHAPGARSAGDQTPDSQTPDVPTVGANSVAAGRP